MTETERLSAALADRYRIEGHLGEGGMATVYLAEDLKHDRKVALKVLRPELAAVLGAERFVREIKTTASLQHPHILPLFDSGEADGFLFYVMPYVEGETLRDKLNRESQLGIEEAVRITTEVADALDYAHRQGVIHRDVKPENILLHDGRPMVADFGIALAVSAAAGGRMTETGMSLGTPHYMSPEQATGEKDITARSDVYSLGSMLYEMLTGSPPHEGGTAQQIIMRIVTDAPRPVTELRKSVPPNVAAVVAKSLEKLAADRFESAAKFAEALANPAFTLPAAQAAAGRARGPWNRLSITTTALAALLLIVAVWGWLRPIPRPVSRYSIALPPGEGLRPADASLIAVSPDGSQIVYMGTDEQRRLWLRRRDELHATPLAGTDGGRQPFFSPDGSRLAFLALGSWRVVSLAGGPPTPIGEADVLGSEGGTWGADGYLYFGGGAIVRVPEGGGAAERVTVLDTTRNEQGHLWPDALPGGRGIVFSIRSGLTSRGTLTGWDVGVADPAGTYTVLTRGVRAVYAESGHLVYLTADGTLMAVPFDATSRALTGDAVALAEGVRVGFNGVAYLAVSATGTLYYTTGAAGVVGLSEMVWVARDGTTEVIDPGWGTGDFQEVALSPDGTQLAVSILGEAGLQIWIKTLDRGPLAKLTFTGSLNFRPVWSPDGGSVTFLSDRGDNRAPYTRRADGTGQAVLLAEDARGIHEVTNSPDGEWLVYRLGDSQRGSDIYGRHMGSDTAVGLVVSEDNETAPAVSPDGRWLAYVSAESDRAEVHVRPFPNTNDGEWQISTGGGTEPVWAHSGRELFYKSNGNLMVVGILPGATFVTGERRVLFSAAEFRSSALHQNYDVASDGEHFVMVRNVGEKSELIVVENFFEELKARVGN
jgi:Tol biopolymer transport system component